MPEHKKGCCLWYFVCSLMLGCVAVFLFLQVLFLLMTLSSLRTHDLPLQQSLEQVASVELVHVFDREKEPDRVTLTEEQMADFLPKLAELKTHGSFGDPIMAYGNLQVILSYENGDQDILTNASCIQITNGVEDMDGFHWLDDDEISPLFAKYFPEMEWEQEDVMTMEYAFRRILGIIATVLCVFLIWGLISTVAIVRYAKVDERYWADTIIVLGAGTDGKEPNPVFRERLNHAITLYEDGFSRHIILTGGLSEGNTLTDSQIAANYLTSNGIPADVILLETKSTITQENLSGARDIMYAEGMTTALIVSDPLHMKRAMLMAQDCGIQPYSSPTPTTRYQTWKTKIPFLLRETFFYVGYRIYRNFVKV